MLSEAEFYYFKLAHFLSHLVYHSSVKFGPRGIFVLDKSRTHMMRVKIFIFFDIITFSMSIIASFAAIQFALNPTFVTILFLSWPILGFNILLDIANLNHSLETVQLLNTFLRLIKQIYGKLKQIFQTENMCCTLPAFHFQVENLMTHEIGS